MPIAVLLPHAMEWLLRKEVMSVSKDSNQYLPLNEEGFAQDSKPKPYYMMRALLSSRVELGLSNEDGPSEEDVNIYLTHLLCDFADPQYHLRVAKYLSDYDTNVFGKVQHSTSDRLKYTVYRANADHILMSMGVFRSTEGKQAKRLPAILQTDSRSYLGRGQSYYDYALTYGRSVFSRSSGMADVLRKLAHGFPTYVRLLEHIRLEYFNFVDQLSVGELYHLTVEIDAQDQVALQNNFLDALNAYRQTPTPENRTALELRVEKLKQLDPEFKFDLPEG